jgi:hypothetical protein
LSSSWKEFKNYLKHKHKEMKLEDLIVRLRIEEDNRTSEKAMWTQTIENLFKLLLLLKNCNHLGKNSRIT